jgi:hypothetical protein
MTIKDNTKPFLTVYPDNWFGRSARGKQHAVSGEGVKVDQHGNPVYVDATGKTHGSRSWSTTALCGVVGTIGGTEFTATEGDVITCSRCARRVKAAREEAAS